MCWSMLLFALREAADEDALNAKRRAERRAEKKREASETDAMASTANESGGVLGSNLDALAGQNDLGELLNVSFKKLVDANASWLTKVMEDATEFAKIHLPRSKNAIKHALQSHDPPSNPAPQSLQALFAANLWPSLRSRGWTAETIVEGEFSGLRRYAHAGKEVGYLEFP
jgi:hypothetical protein